jgi:hypothetical protein
VSDPTRYEVEGCMEPSKKGDFVMWSDYAKLKAENQRFRKAFKDIEAAWYKGRSSYVIAIVDDALAKQTNTK